MPKPVSADLDLSFLVPCGQEVQVFPENQNGKDMICYASECSVCSVQIMAMKVLNFLIFIMTGVAALIFAYAGALYALSPGNQGNIKKAHSMFLSTLVGMVIVLAAWLIVDTVMRALYAEESTGWGPWQDMLCNNYEAAYCVPKLEGMIAESKQATRTCLEQGGQCKTPIACMYVVENGRQTTNPTGSTVVNGTDCEKTTAAVDNLHCCIPATAGNSCVMANNVKGACGQMDSCPDTGEATSGCKNGLVCCPGTTPSPPPPSGGPYDTTKVTSQQARDMLRAAGVKMQDFSDGPEIQKGVIDNIIAMNKACGGCVTVNSLSGGHATGGHVAGTKMDLSTRPEQGGPQLEQYITSQWEKMSNRTGNNGGPQYYSPMNGGIVCVKESSPSHWDCCNNHNKSVCN